MQVRKGEIDAFDRTIRDSIQSNLRSYWRLVIAVDPGEISQISAASFGVKSFGVTTLAFFERSIDIDLYKFVRRELRTGGFAFCAIGTDECEDNNETGVDEQAGNLHGPANILYPVSLRESQVPVEPVPHVVTIENISVSAGDEQLLFEEVRNCRLARTRQTGQPEAKRLLQLLPGAGVFIDI